MPTTPNSCRLASATNALPAPTTMSTGSRSSMPKAMAARAWTPPMATISSAPDEAMANSCGGWMPCPARGGAQATTLGTPATFGTTTVMIEDASIG
jgi:hypothetical protein